MGAPVGMFDMLISSPRVSTKPSHLGKMMNMSVDSRKTCCNRLDKALSPTIVSKDKRQYAIYTDFDKMRNKYRRVHQEINRRSDNFLVSKRDQLKMAVNLSKKVYLTIPESFRNDGHGMVEI